MGFRTFVQDNWTQLSYKRALGNQAAPGQTFTQPIWVGEHQRRLTAYQLLQAYLDNAGRFYLPDADSDTQQLHREYGDPALLRDTIMDALLGQDQQIEVDGAADAGKDGASSDAQQAADLQDWLRDLWENQERGQLKLIEVERDAVGLGDGVYSIGWSGTKGRPRIRVWDPGFYFPVLEDGNEDDFPERVHVAWEIDRSGMPQPSGGKVEVRRLTWELVQLDAPRNYPWNDKPSDQTCLYSDATWHYDPGQTTTIDQLDPTGATYATGEDGLEIRQVDMQIDFIPVVHIPNTVSIKEHYGRSSISTVLQLLDDLASADTDLAAAGVTAAEPIMTLEKGTLGTTAPTYKPGEVWETGEGKLGMLDNSRGLDALLKLVEHLLSRLSVNARVPESIMGRIKPSEVPSGVALALSFGPLSGMIAKMRLARADKYPILFRFIWRMALAGQMPDVPTTWYPTHLEFGSYLPSDLSSIVDVVVRLRMAQPPVISAETAIDILVSAGMKVDDAEQEVTRIEGRDFAGAAELHNATGSSQLAADYLQVELPPPPAPLVPPVPGGPVVVPPTPPGPPGGLVLPGPAQQ